jgi:hypothetical protein
LNATAILISSRVAVLFMTRKAQHGTVCPPEPLWSPPLDFRFSILYFVCEKMTFAGLLQTAASADK